MTVLPEPAIPVLPTQEFRQAVLREVAAGRRIEALFGRPLDGNVRLYAVLGETVLATDATERFPSLTPDCPQAHAFEREILEQHGVRPEGHPWLKPLRAHAPSYPFFQVEGEEVHEVAVGPVHAGLIDPGHFRLQCHGEKVLSLEVQLGYQHRGVEEALVGGPGRRAAVLAESIAGDTAVGHGLAHTEALEALAGCEVPPRARALRAMALELERVANHVGDLGALGTDIAFLPTSAWFGRLRGEFLNLLLAWTGNRYGRGLIRQGGVRFDLDSGLAEELAFRLERARAELVPVARLFFGTSSVRARLEGTGTLARETCGELGLLGPVARASREGTGDVLARAQVRWSETEGALAYLLETVAALPPGPLRAPCGPLAPGCLAVSRVEGWRGEIVHVAITDGAGRFARYKVVDPSFQNWTGLAHVLRGMQVSDFPLCNKSFNLSYAGHDL